MDLHHLETTLDNSWLISLLGRICFVVVALGAFQLVWWTCLPRVGHWPSILWTFQQSWVQNTEWIVSPIGIFSFSLNEKCQKKAHDVNWLVVLAEASKAFTSLHLCTQRKVAPPQTGLSPTQHSRTFCCFLYLRCICAYVAWSFCTTKNCNEESGTKSRASVTWKDIDLDLAESRLRPRGT